MLVTNALFRKEKPPFPQKEGARFQCTQGAPHHPYFDSENDESKCRCGEEMAESYWKKSQVPPKSCW